MGARVLINGTWYYSQDLRDRVIDAALAGTLRGRRRRGFGIGDATAIVWVRRARQNGERTARKQAGAAAALQA